MNSAANDGANVAFWEGPCTPNSVAWRQRPCFFFSRSRASRRQRSRPTIRPPRRLAEAREPAAAVPPTGPSRAGPSFQGRAPACPASGQRAAAETSRARCASNASRRKGGPAPAARERRMPTSPGRRRRAKLRRRRIRRCADSGNRRDPDRNVDPGALSYALGDRAFGRGDATVAQRARSTQGVSLSPALFLSRCSIGA